MSLPLSGRLALPEDSPIGPVAEAIADAGGRALVVGGWVRDQLLGRDAASPDVDLEVQGLAPDAVERALARFGPVRRVGRSFPVHIVRLASGLAFDVSLPRTADPGADGAPPGFDPHLEFAEAARGRDLRINAMGFDPLTGELLDPHDGQRDLEEGVLRATDPSRFGRDPLRGLRVARLAAVLGMSPDDELLRLCAETDLSGVAAERIFGELRRLLLEAERPSAGFDWLQRAQLLEHFPELAALVGVRQDPQWHPEGDVWTHTLLCLDVAAGLRGGDASGDLLLMLGVLCHDFGKPASTEEREGRIISHGHDQLGVAPTEALLQRLRAPNAVVRGVCALVRHHLAPALFVAGSAPAGPKGYRRLLRRLREAGCDADLLWRVARADHLGRTTDEARACEFPAGDVFLERAREVECDPGTFEAAVTGAWLVGKGIEPGPGLGLLLERCRAVQDETGLADPDAIYQRVREAGDSTSG